MLQLICSIWSLYDDTLQYATICLFSDNSLHYRYVFIKHGKCKQTLTPSSRYSHKYMTKCQQTTRLVEACLQNVNKQRDWSRRAYDQWRFWWTTDDLVSYRILACKMKDLRGLVWVKRRLGESISTSLARSEATGSTGPWAPEMLHYLSGWRPKGATIH